MASPSSKLLATVSIAAPFAGTTMLPDEAEACSIDPCFYVDMFSALEPVNAALIPVDGVLLLQGAQTGDSPDADWLARIDLTVTRDGQPIAGAIETSPINDLLIWRPAEPLAPGSVFHVVGTLDNPDAEPYYEGCAPDILMLDFEFQSDAGPSTPLAAPEVAAEETVQTTPRLWLDELVCCDGGYPYEYAFDCGGSGTYVDWSPGFCASLVGFGQLRVQLTVTHDLPEATAAMVTRQVIVDGQPGAINLQGTLPASRDAPICTEVVLHNLATGEKVTSSKQCHGEAVADQLGQQALDPSAELAEKCAGAAYTCELNESGDRWDEEKCTPWPPEGATTGESTGDPPDPTEGATGESGDAGTSGGSAEGGQDDLIDHGCACDAKKPGHFGALALLGLGLLRRRRRLPRRVRR